MPDCKGLYDYKGGGFIRLCNQDMIPHNSKSSVVYEKGRFCPGTPSYRWNVQGNRKWSDVTVLETAEDCTPGHCEGKLYHAYEGFGQKTNEAEGFGLKFSYTKKREWKRGWMKEWTRKWHEVRRCVTYRRTETESYQRGERRVHVSISNKKTLWESRTYQEKTYPAAAQRAIALTYGVSVSGENKLLANAGWKQSWKAGGQLKFERPTFFSPVKVSGKLEFELEAGYRVCQNLGLFGGIVQLSVFFGGSTEIFADDIVMEAYGGLRGKAEGYGTLGTKFCKCSNDFDDCYPYVGASVEGKLYVKVYGLGCGKTTQMDVGLNTQVELKVGALWSFGFKHSVVFINGRRIGTQKDC